MQTELTSISYGSLCDRDFIQCYLSGEYEATAKMKTLHAAAHRA